MASRGHKYRFGADFDDVVQESQIKHPWYHIDWKSYINTKTIYIIAAGGSFLLLFIYGALCIDLHDECLVVESNGVCCQCLKEQENIPNKYKQTIPRETKYNDIYYGIIIMLGACFGLGYVYLGISQENRFLFFCMAATQAIEILRTVLDEIMSSSIIKNSSRIIARRIVLGCACIFMIISWCLLRKVYKMFGWRIFRRGGAQRAVREMYKTYQRYRACNLLDIQASFLLFVVLVFFVQSSHQDRFWVLIMVLLCEFVASRYAVKYLKREDYYGVIISALSKFIALIWWTLTLAEYANCWGRFEKSRRETNYWYTSAFFPSLHSVSLFYDGGDCRTSHTAFDIRVVELIIINYTFAVIFRVISFIIGLQVVFNFGKGMKTIFYVRPRPIAGDYSSSTIETQGGEFTNEFNNDNLTSTMQEASRPFIDK